MSISFAKGQSLQVIICKRLANNNYNKNNNNNSNNNTALQIVHWSTPFLTRY